MAFLFAPIQAIRELRFNIGTWFVLQLRSESNLQDLVARFGRAEIDALLKQQMAMLPEDSTIQSWLESNLRAKTGPFTGMEKTYYAIEDTMIIDAIRELDHKSDVAEDLRKMSSAHEGPFREPPQQVIVGFPSDIDALVDGVAAMCPYSKYYDHTITLSNTNRLTSIKVTVSARGSCHIEPGWDGKELIQVNPRMGKRLFGCTLPQTAEVYAEIIKGGDTVLETPDPDCR